MFNKYFSIIYEFISRHKVTVISGIICLVVAGSIGAFFIQYDNNIEIMLPKDREVSLGMRFLRHSHLSNKAAIALSLNSDSYTTKDLMQAVDNFSQGLKSPLIEKVTFGISQVNPQEEVKKFLRFSPQILSSKDLVKVDTLINPSGVDAALRDDYNKLFSPQGSFLAPFISLDPLGLKTAILRNLNNISTALGYNVIVEEGHFLSPDKRSALLIIDTNVTLTDGFGSRSLINLLQEKIKLLPGYISASIAAGHMHSVSNEDVIKKDIQRTVTIAMIAFLTVFLLTFKDLRALIFLIIPVGAVILALNLSAFVFGKLSYFIIGLGAVIIGVADDYGIHTYVAVHTSGKKDAVKEIAKPLFIAALTTISVFITFFFSSVQGYHQLAFFSIVSILFCLFFVLFVFPHFLKTPEMPDREVSHGRVGKPIISDSTRILLWIITTVFLLSVSFNSKFSSDISDLDGSSKSVISSEERFKHIFSRKDEPAMLIVFAKAQEDALKRNEQIYSEASSFIGEKNIVSFTNIWPSLKTREENVLAWKRFWDIEREKKLKSLLNKYSAKYDFSKDAFNPFFQSLHSGLDTRESPDDLEIFKGIKDRFVQHDESLWEIISFFPDRDDLVKPILRLSRNNPDTLVVSRKAFSEAISRGVTREMLFLSLIAGALVIVLTVALLKDLKLTLISLASVFTAIISITGLFALLNKPLNVAVIISSMMVIGLCIDYGVFMLYSFKHELNTGTVKAIWVSALTTLIGAFSLLFAKHPVLFSVGLTLVAGLSSGYLTSQTVIPALYRMLIKEDNAR